MDWEQFQRSILSKYVMTMKHKQPFLGTSILLCEYVKLIHIHYDVLYIKRRTGIIISVISCGGLDEIANGGISYSSGTYYNSTATHYCDQGYKIVGSETRTCQPDGTWSGMTVSCESNYNYSRTVVCTVVWCS